jgi:hypothetical protein
MIHSPNNVLSKYLKEVIDIVRPRIEIDQPKEIELYVGVNINGVPHIGTYIVQCTGFMLAKRIREKFGISTKIIFGINDNVSYDSKNDGGGNVYHRTYFHVLGENGVEKIINENYTSFFEILKDQTKVPYTIQTYSAFQKSVTFRENFLKTLGCAKKIGWCVAPSTGKLQVRIPCSKCLYSERDAAQTELIELNDDSAKFRCKCLTHGPYITEVRIDNSDVYLDLSTLYRNVVKEFSMIKTQDKLNIVVKGGDWIYSTQMIDCALGVLGYSAIQSPVRFFTPQIITETGAKLSKSFIAENEASMNKIPEWLTDMNKFKHRYPDDYAKKIMSLVESFLGDPRHVFRSYSCDEIIRLLK